MKENEQQLIAPTRAYHFCVEIQSVHTAKSEHVNYRTFGK